MRKILKYLLLAGLLTVTIVFGHGELRASVVIGQQSLAIDAGAEDAGAEDEVGELLEFTSVSDSDASPLLLFAMSAPKEQEPDRDGEHEELGDILGNSPLGMAPSNTSLSQAAGVGIGGFAIANDLETLPQDSLKATLSPESRVNLPRGPTFRWFRPPRNWS